MPGSNLPGICAVDGGSSGGLNLGAFQGKRFDAPYRHIP